MRRRRKLQEAGVAFHAPIRSRSGVFRLPGVLLLDSMGELSGLFSRADVVFMGGTIVPRGGHNILEPAMFGKPIVVGRHMENFREIADAFRAAGAMVEIASGSELAGAVGALLKGPGARSRAWDVAPGNARRRSGGYFHGGLADPAIVCGLCAPLPARFTR